MTENKRNGDKPGIAVKTVAGAVGVAGTLIRLTAGFVVLAWIGCLFKDRLGRK